MGDFHKLAEEGFGMDSLIMEVDNAIGDQRGADGNEFGTMMVVLLKFSTLVISLDRFVGCTHVIGTRV